MKTFLENIFEISHSKHTAIRSMEGLRGAAVFLVFLVHYSSLSQPYVSTNSVTGKISTWMHTVGNVGVDLFFVLSGFLIYGMLLRRPQSFFSYFKRRVQRIYPVFTAIFLVYIVLSFVFPSESKIPPQPTEAAIFILQNFLLLPGIFDIQAIITVAWSLSYEFFFYLLVPLLIGILRLRKWSYVYRIVFLLTAAVAGFIYVAQFGGHVRMLMFIAGMMLYEVSSHTSVRPMKNLGWLAIFLSIFVLLIFPQWGFSSAYQYVALFCLMFVLCWECFDRSGSVQDFFSWAPLRWYGNMSYSYYLFHGLVLKAFFLVIGLVLSGTQGQWIFWLFFLPAFFLTLFGSGLVFALIEKPYSLSRKK